MFLRGFALLYLAASGVGAAFITQEDYDLADAASRKTAAVCQDFEVLAAEQKAKAKEDLMMASAGNILQTLLEEAADGENVADLFIAKVQDPAFVARAAGPLAFAILMMILYVSIFCWCGCCRYCRCCKRHHHCPRCAKLIFLILLVAIGFALTLAAFLTLNGLGAAVDGVDRTACSSAQLMNTTLQGQQNPNFLGLLPLLEMLQTISDSLNPDSDFITRLKSVLDNTQGITKAVTLASQTKSLLNDMMKDAANQMPKDGDGNSLKHECRLCSQLSSVLEPAISALDGGVASALEAAREEVNTQLSGDKLLELQSNFEAMSAPVDQFKMSLKSAMGPLIQEEVLESVKLQMSSTGTAGGAAFGLLALVLAATALLSVLCWFCQRPGNPKGIVHRCACCTWNCGCWYLILAFFVGGLLTLLLVPLSSFCLILEDLDGNLLRDISATAGLNFTGPTGDMAISLVENCLNPPTEMNPALLDLITTTDANGTTMSMNEAVVGQVTSQITEQFNAISTDAGAELAETEAMQTLISTLADLKMDQMMLPVESLASNEDFSPMLTQERLRNFLMTSTSCSDAEVEGTTFYGIASFVANLSHYGTVEFHSTCAKEVDCSGTQQDACDAANRFIGLKQELLSVQTFKCKFFKDANGQKCDITGMIEISEGVYMNDCFLPDGTLQTMEELCTLQEFTTVVSSFATQIELAIERLDKATPQALQAISVQMKELVEEYLLNPIGLIVSGVTCGFMAEQYGNFVDALCFRGVWGLAAIAASYVAAAVLTLFIVILMFFAWRFSIDAYEAETGTNPSLRAPDRE